MKSKHVAIIILLPIVLLVLPQRSLASPLFHTRLDFTVQDFPTGDTPISVAIGDLDMDNNLDLAVVNYWSDSVSVLLGNGDGTFQTAVSYGVGHMPKSVAIGDLDGDGAMDLAVANFASDGVSVLLGNGDGTFQAAVSYGAGDGPKSVAIGDLDGDGDLDLAVALNYSENYTSNVSVLLGNGDGTFQTAVNYGVGRDPSSVAIGDLNGDQNPDLAVTNNSSEYVSVLLGNGDGTFQTAVNYGADGPFHFVAIGDLDMDNNLDLVMVNHHRTIHPVSVLLGNGDGTFQTAVNYGVGRDPSSVAIGDLNGDQNPDLAVTYESSDDVSVLLGNGDGTFQTAVGYGVGKKPKSVAIGDLDMDNNLDLAVANFGDDDVSVLLGNGDGTFPNQVPTLDIKANGQDEVVLVTPQDNVDLTISLDPESMEGELYEWWVLIWMGIPPNWIFPVLIGQIPLFDLPAVSFFSGQLPEGMYGFYFALDDPDGLFIPKWYDWVVVVSQSQGH